ncbi:hypothetical protein WDU94_013079 [Cyamophila willieti]
MEVKKFVLLMIVGVLCLSVESIPLSQSIMEIHHSNSLNHIDYKNMGCSFKCPPFYKPVCAVDESGYTKDFKNVCFLHLSYCTERKVYAYVKEGFC